MSQIVFLPNTIVLSFYLIAVLMISIIKTEVHQIVEILNSMRNSINDMIAFDWLFSSTLMFSNILYKTKLTKN